MSESQVSTEPIAESAESWSRSGPALLGYVLPVTVVIAVFAFINLMSGHLPAPLQQGVEKAVTGQALHPFLHVLIALAAVLAVGAVLRKVMIYFGQPPVIGEVLAGIALGPSLFGVEWSTHLMPPTVAPYLKVIADLGIILYMFVVGLELNLRTLKDRAPTLVMISQISVALPFILGCLLALALFTRLSISGTSFMAFAIFMGVAMSVTAFPVLARILVDRGMQNSPLGILALGCAAVDDVTAWCLLALAVGIAQSQTGGALITAIGAVIYIGSMLLVAQPLLAKLDARYSRTGMPPSALTVVFLAILISALISESIGIHAIFGAFLLGLLLPHDGVIAKSFTRHLLPIVTALMLPAFFAYTGMRTRIDLLNSVEDWVICGVIIAVATFGKVGGTYVAARIRGMPQRDSFALGALMNTRGLVELIVLNVGLTLNVISPSLFSMMTVMAIITTLSTMPLLRLVSGRQSDGSPIRKIA